MCGMQTNPSFTLGTDQLSHAACYLAMQTRDARFDGRFFTAVTSTGIYCRPVCAARTPRRENCRFFELAAQAEQAYFRPCLRCRPELAPLWRRWSSTDATRILAQEAASWLDDPAHWRAATRPTDHVHVPRPSLLQNLAQRLGVSKRHVRRVFAAAWGISPLQYLQTRRLLCAKQLLSDTPLPVVQVALLSGFGSLRRFNAAFVQHYALNPQALRQQRKTRAATGALSTALPASQGKLGEVKLGFRPPFAWQTLARFLQQRQIAGMEQVDISEAGFTLTRTLTLGAYCGWLQVRLQASDQYVRLRCSDSLQPVLPQLICRVRAWPDLEADPAAVESVLAPHLGPLQGLRVPGSPDGFELAVRAILGQQISVAAARTLTQRLVKQLGQALPAACAASLPVAGLTHFFPRPETLAALGQETQIKALLGCLGIVRQRQNAIHALACAVQQGALELQQSAPLQNTLSALRALPGVGDWTAQYIALRALRWPDAFPAGDVALQNALGTRHLGSPKRVQAATEAASSAWRPWRAYAVVQIWTHGAPAVAIHRPIGTSKELPIHSSGGSL